MRSLGDGGDGDMGGIVKDSKYTKEAFAVVEGVSRATLDAWALEAEAHYNATLDRGEYIEKRHNRAEQEHKYFLVMALIVQLDHLSVFRKTEELLKRVLANKLNDTSFENLLNRSEEFDQWLEDFRATIYDSAKKDTTEAERMSKVVAKRIDRYKVSGILVSLEELSLTRIQEVSNEIEKLRAEAEEDLATARDSVDQAKGRVREYKVSGILVSFENLRAEAEEDLATARDSVDQAKGRTLGSAEELSQECRNISMMYAQLIDEYDDIFVQSAAEHAETLERTANVLKNSFTDTRTEAEDPLKASQAYEEIASALKNATAAAELAVKAAEDAYAEADESSEHSMVKKVNDSKANSQALANGSFPPAIEHAKNAY
ncbi:unnamed protein product [Strongylus vulgaris]|uniref:Uncharacterized protein n=1 Tax=Strongylus vulgaris TaxID=40348 RepID=A0A3P7JCZ9_STRVU|nr:unnamed protein product [Strongylus vulgaris]